MIEYFVTDNRMTNFQSTGTHFVKLGATYSAACRNFVDLAVAAINDPNIINYRTLLPASSTCFFGRAVSKACPEI